LNLKDDSSLIRNTCYLLGVFCENAGSIVSTQYNEYLALVYPAFTANLDQGTLDNAVACLGRMMIGSIQSIPLSNVLPVWFQNLPLKDDFEEVKTIVRTIAHLL